MSRVARLPGFTEAMRERVPVLLAKLRERFPGLKATLHEMASTERTLDRAGTIEEEIETTKIHSICGGSMTATRSARTWPSALRIIQFPTWG